MSTENQVGSSNVELVGGDFPVEDSMTPFNNLETLKGVFQTISGKLTRVIRDLVDAVASMPSELPEVGNEITQETLNTLVNVKTFVGQFEPVVHELSNVSSSLVEFVPKLKVAVKTGDGASGNPMLTMEAVRVALRVDSGQQAVQNQQRSKQVGAPKPTTALSKQTNLSGKGKQKSCWICEGPHYANENEECRKKLKEIRARAKEKKEKDKQNTDKEDFFGKSQAGASSSRSKISLFWSNPPDRLFTGMNLVDCTWNNNELLYSIVDGGA